jgi:chitin disaccharide deacetylase
MSIPNNLIINADDLGHDGSVNKAILYCFEHGLINSTSLMTNTEGYQESVDMIHNNGSIVNIGIHVNLMSNKPLSNFKRRQYLEETGVWNKDNINRVFNYFDSSTRAEFSKEIYAQIDRALKDKIQINHLDSHLHIHNLPCFYNLFLDAAKHYGIKLRLAQTYNNGNYIKFYYRKYINNIIKASKCNYSDYFVTVDSLFEKPTEKTDTYGISEIMLHPDFDANGALIDSFDDPSLKKWLQYLQLHS